MAVSTTSFFSNASPGEVQLFPGNIFRQDTTPKFPVGFRVTLAGGREYRYSHFGADTNRGLLVSQDLSESSVVDTDNVMIAPASATEPTDGTINSRFIQLTLASITAGQFAGGTLHTTDDTGEGFTYFILGNTATGDPVSGDIRLSLGDPLQVAIDATTDFGILGSLYANVEASTAATDIAVAGVSVNTMDVSAAAYGFVQTKGAATILQDGAIVIGGIVSLSDGVAGAVHALGGGGVAVGDLISEPLVGYCAIAGDDTGHGSFVINLG